MKNLTIAAGLPKNHHHYREPWNFQQVSSVDHFVMSPTISRKNIIVAAVTRIQIFNDVFVRQEKRSKTVSKSSQKVPSSTSSGTENCRFLSARFV